MTFLAPGWLFALGALALPIALHLWSRRGGTPIRVGSIRLLIGSPPAVRRAWRVQDPWLLLLRAAVLAALVLALAEPSRPRGGKTPPTWALISGDLTQPGDSLLSDSLTRAGIPVRRLNPENLWAALRDADAAAPPGTRFVVFAPDLLRYFHGTRPTIRAAVEWRVRTPPPAPVAPVTPTVREPRRVLVHADADAVDDSRYLTAAIRAAAGATGIPAVVTRQAADAERADWFIWLSRQSVPAHILARVRNGATLVQDGGAAARGARDGERRDRITFAHQTSTRPSTHQADGLETRAPVPPADSAAPLWTDGVGRPLLSVERVGRGLTYRFAGRFHPVWSDLVLHPEFPQAFATLWASVEPPDERRLAMSQLLPVQASGAEPALAAAPGRSWFIALWLLALLLFALERWLSR